MERLLEEANESKSFRTVIGPLWLRRIGPVQQRSLSGNCCGLWIDFVRNLIMRWAMLATKTDRPRDEVILSPPRMPIYYRGAVCVADRFGVLDSSGRRISGGMRGSFADSPNAWRPGFRRAPPGVALR